MQTITIDTEFQALIPDLTSEERTQLEANLVADGCLSPLIVWDNTLIDGHNRHEICTRLKIDFQTVEKQFESREAAKDWIDANQLGRRNLTSDQRTIILGRRYNRTKRSHGAERGGRGNQHTQQPQNLVSGQNDHLPTAKTIATQHGVSEKTSSAMHHEKQ
jgi:hypothetical protein